MSNPEYTIEVSDEQSAMTVCIEAIERVVAFVLEQLGCRGGSVSVAVVGDRTIRELKSRFFGRNETTDVISFDVSGPVVHPPGVEGAPPVVDRPVCDEAEGGSEEARWTGLDVEVVVNAEQALREAQGDPDGGQAELALYVVHGLLHQLGYDDQAPSLAAEMHRKEDELLSALGYGRVYSDEKKRGKG